MLMDVHTGIYWSNEKNRPRPDLEGRSSVLTLALEEEFYLFMFFRNSARAAEQCTLLVSDLYWFFLPDFHRRSNISYYPFVFCPCSPRSPLSLL